MTTSTETRPLSTLALAVLGKMTPIVEADPARLNAMADALLHYADLYGARGKVGLAESNFRRACELRDRAETWPCCGVSRRDYCAC